MSYPINYPTPQGANVQVFKYATEYSGSTQTGATWIKPQGASFVWFTLIGPGGRGGDGDSLTPSEGAGGGSGAVTNFMGPAFLMPDSLVVKVGKGGVTFGSSTTQVGYKSKSGTYYQLLVANAGSPGGSSGGVGGAGGTVMSNNYFTTMGILNSTAGQAGANPSIATTASTTTFLSGGSSAINSTGNYGYALSAQPGGFFQTQPIMVGVAGTLQQVIATTGVAVNSSAIGCGGAGGQANDRMGVDGGNGMVVIITW